MRTEYAVYLYNQNREAIRTPLPGFARLEYVNRLMDLGYISLEFNESELPQGTDIDKIGADYRVVVWRHPDGLRNTVDFAGLLRSPELSLSGQSVVLSAEGASYNELLLRRIVPFDAGSPQADKSGPADTVLYQIYDENLGAGAAADMYGLPRNITAQGFTQRAVAGNGTVVTVAFSRANVLQAMQKVHWQSRRQLNEATWFNFTPQGNGLDAVFEIRRGLWGADRRDLVTFNVENGNVSNPRYRVDRRAELTMVYSAGQGTGAARLEGDPQYDYNRLTDSPLNRREGFFDGSNYKTKNALEAASFDLLNRSGIVRKMSFDVQETEGCRYGRHWFLGDIVSGEFIGTTQRYKRPFLVAGVRVIVAAGQDTVSAILEEWNG